MAVTLKDIASLAGVSTATVSRVLNNDGKIAPATKERVLACVDKTGYRMNTIARSLKIAKTHTVGFITPEIANDFLMSIAQGVEDTLQENGYSMIICNSNEQLSEEKKRIDLLLENRVDGAIIIPTTDSGEHYTIFDDQHVPVVLADRLVSGYQADAVLANNVDGAYRAVQHLINSGTEHFGFIGGDMALTSAKERYEGFTNALRDHGVVVDKGLIRFGDFHIDSGYRLMGELMSNSPPPDHVFIANHYMHVGATKYLIDHRERLSSKVEFASFDDMSLSSILGFCTLNVRQPVEEIGRKAAELLLNRIDGDEKESPLILRVETELISHPKLW